MAYYSVEPFGGVRGDLQTAVLMALIANTNRDPKKHDPFRPSEFMLEFWKDEQAEAPDHTASLLAKMMMFSGDEAIG